MKVYVLFLDESDFRAFYVGAFSTYEIAENHIVDDMVKRFGGENESLYQYYYIIEEDLVLGNMRDHIQMPAISCSLDTEKNLFRVQMVYASNGAGIGISPHVSRLIATDLLLWADRVDKLNEENDD